ncbi:MAG: phage Gp37/Gp68 family protein [Planctomycetota bacterium]
MAENSGIEWTDNTFNPWMGCTKVSPACKNCYAERDFDHRYQKVKWGPSGTRVVTTDANWRKPIKWNREAEETGTRKRVFCASLADVFEDWQGPMVDNKGIQLFEDEPNGVAGHVCTPTSMWHVRLRLFNLILETPFLDWLLLTKRPENSLDMWPADPRWDEGVPRSFDNVWLGTSIENQEWTDKRLRFLREAKELQMVNTTFVSAEPLVGPIDLGDNHELDWVITGGESGPDARPCDLDWFRSLRDQCEATNTPFHFKQWGEFDAERNRVGKKNAGRLLDGRTHDGLPRQTTLT